MSVPTMLNAPQRNLGIELQELLCQFERRLDSLHAEREDFDDRIVVFVRTDRDLQNRRSVFEVEVAMLGIVEVFVDELVEVRLHLPVHFLLALRVEPFFARGGHWSLIIGT